MSRLATRHSWRLPPVADCAGRRGLHRPSSGDANSPLDPLPLRRWRRGRREASRWRERIFSRTSHRRFAKVCSFGDSGNVKYCIYRRELPVEAKGDESGRSLEEIAQSILLSRDAPMFCHFSSEDSPTKAVEVSPIVQLSNYHRALVYDDLDEEPCTERAREMSHLAPEPTTPASLLGWATVQKYPLSQSQCMAGVLFCCRARDRSGVVPGIDYGVILSFLWGNVWMDGCKYTAIMTASLISTASPQLAPTSHSDGGLPSCIHMSELGTLLYKEATRNALLDFSLKGLKGENMRLSNVFLHEDISPFFYLLPSERCPSETVLYMNTKKICEEAQIKRENDHGASAINKRMKIAQGVLRRAGLRHLSGL